MSSTIPPEACHLSLPQSRCSAKSHSSSCLSSDGGGPCFEGGGPPLWTTLLLPPLTVAPSRHKKKKKRRKKHRRGHGENAAAPAKRARLAVGVVALSLVVFSFLLVGLTLRMAPIIDELVRKGNEEIYRSMSAGASTPAPSTEGATNHTTPPSG